MKAILARRRSGIGYHWLTKEMPTLTPIGMTGIMEAYVTPGDILGVSVCDEIAKEFGFELEPLQAQGCVVLVRPIGEPFFLKEISDAPRH